VDGLVIMWVNIARLLSVDARLNGPSAATIISIEGVGFRPSRREPLLLQRGYRSPRARKRAGCEYSVRTISARHGIGVRSQVQVYRPSIVHQSGLTVPS
jgi:hypothetical protein